MMTSMDIKVSNLIQFKLEIILAKIYEVGEIF